MHAQHNTTHLNAKRIEIQHFNVSMFCALFREQREYEQKKKNKKKKESTQSNIKQHTNEHA